MNFIGVGIPCSKALNRKLLTFGGFPDGHLGFPLMRLYSTYLNRSGFISSPLVALLFSAIHRAQSPKG
jgi:hypothetical protein